MSTSIPARRTGEGARLSGRNWRDKSGGQGGGVGRSGRGVEGVQGVREG